MHDPSHSSTAVVLATGEGKRVRSSPAKVFHPLVGRSTVRRIVAAAREADSGRRVVIVGPRVEGL